MPNENQGGMRDEAVVAHGLTFEPYIRQAEIQARVAELGAAISARYRTQRPLFLVVLNGAFIFAADLLRACRFECEVTFIRLASYRGTRSSGRVKEIIGLQDDIRGRAVIIVEDIVDSGNTLSSLLPELQALAPASVEIASLLLKPDMLEHELEVQYVGFEIDPRFVIGYGLDYDGLGRNLPAIYRKVKET